jgi:hypothetical protein
MGEHWGVMNVYGILNCVAGEAVRVCARGNGPWSASLQHIRWAHHHIEVTWCQRKGVQIRDL